MKVKDPHFILEKIEKYIQEDIRPSRIRAAVDLENWKYYETSMEEKTDTACAADFDDSAWQDLSSGIHGADMTGWPGSGRRWRYRRN